jgi:hypothetical protein
MTRTSGLRPRSGHGGSEGKPSEPAGTSETELLLDLRYAFIVGRLFPSFLRSGLQSQECTLRARPGKSLFLLQHNLPQSCAAATHDYPRDVNFMQLEKEGGEPGASARLDGRDARPSTSTKPQNEYFNEN